MTSSQSAGAKNRTAYFAFALAGMSCLLGLFFCLVKSPQIRAEAYVTRSIEALASGQERRAVLAALEAVKLDPMQPRAWQILSGMLQKRGDAPAAAQAKLIAAKVQQNPADHTPVYAMPAEFRLSLLALSETRIP